MVEGVKVRVNLVSAHNENNKWTSRYNELCVSIFIFLYSIITGCPVARFFLSQVEFLFNLF